MLLQPLLKPNRAAKKNQLAKCTAIFLMSMTFSAFCRELDISGTLNTTGYVYETELGDNEATRTKAVTIKPSLLGKYSSRLLSASLAAKHTRVKKSGNGTSSIQAYTDVSYTGALTLIENALSLTLNGAQNYRVVNQQQADFSDDILSSDNLTKSRSNSAQLNFSIPNPIYLGFTLVSTYSKTQTDQSQESTLGLDSDNLGISASLFQGRQIRNINFNISAQYKDTSRANLQNFKSAMLQTNFGFPIMKNIEFVLTGNMEKYNTVQTVYTNNSNLDTISYGAGLKWAPSNERNLALTYNQLDEGDEKTEFLGLDLAWAFSSRTSLNFNYGKRFYGDAYSLNFKHSLKSLRTSVSYSEDVTSFARLNASGPNITGIFVCAFGSTELTDCFQPDSLNYQLQVGEEFRAATEIDTDISEEVLFRKSGTATIGYDKRKVKISIDATYLRTEYLESDRLRVTKRLSFNVNYALSRKTNISLVSTLANNQYSELAEPETTVTTNLSFARNMSRYLKLNIAARILDRESDNLERNGSNKRITVGLNYIF